MEPEHECLGVFLCVLAGILPSKQMPEKPECVIPEPGVIDRFPENLRMGKLLTDLYGKHQIGVAGIPTATVGPGGFVEQQARFKHNRGVVSDYPRGMLQERAQRGGFIEQNCIG